MLQLGDLLGRNVLMRPEKMEYKILYPFLREDDNVISRNPLEEGLTKLGPLDPEFLHL